MKHNPEKSKVLCAVAAICAWKEGVPLFIVMLYGSVIIAVMLVFKIPLLALLIFLMGGIGIVGVVAGFIWLTTKATRWAIRYREDC